MSLEGVVVAESSLLSIAELCSNRVASNIGDLRLRVRNKPSRSDSQQLPTSAYM